MKKLNQPKNAGILLLLVLILGSLITTYAQDAQNKGTYIELKMHSTSLENNFLGDSPDRFVSVYLPPGYYSSPEKHYPVIYFLHGYTNGHTTFFGTLANFQTICDMLISTGVIDPVIVVSPNSYNKYRGSFYTNSIVTGNWEDYIVKDVTNYIDRNFSTLPQTESRGLAGHCMGGYGTFWFSMNYPEIYAAAYSLSGRPALEPYLENNTNMIIARNAKSFEGLDWEVQACVATSAAGSPDTTALPFYAQFPVDDSGEIIDSIWQKWSKNDPLTQLPYFKDNLLKLKAIQFDVGIYDSNDFINCNRNYSAALTDLGIPHVFEEYEGDHTNKLAKRIETKLLPFFFENLLDTMITGSLSPELIQWQEIDAKENFSLKETFNLDTTVWKSDSVSYKIIAGDPENLFSIDNMNRTISADTMMIDYEVKDAYDLLVEATYRNGQEIVRDTADIYIRVENVYDSPTTISDAAFEIMENSEPNTVVGTIPIVNPENVSLSFKITDGNINGTFKINTQGIIQVRKNDSLNYESYKQFILQVVMIEASGTKSRDTAIITINVLNDPTDFSSIIEGNNLKIYPNPVKDKVNIKIPDLGTKYLTISTLTGKLICSEEMDEIETQIDLSPYQSGIYIITIRSKDFVTTKKIIKL